MLAPNSPRLAPARLPDSKLWPLLSFLVLACFAGDPSIALGQSRFFDDTRGGSGVEAEGPYEDFHPDGPDNDGCGGCQDDPSCCCCNRSRFWASADYLLWWVKGFSTPPLVTTSPVGTSQADAGVLGQPNTSVLFGGNDLVNTARSGGRVRVGCWLDPCQNEGIEASYFALASASSTFHADSQTTPIIARPFFNDQPGFMRQDSELVAYPGVLSGNITVRATSTLQGAELLMRGGVCQTCCSRVDVLAGWRFAQLNDDLLINDFKTVLSTSTGLPVGTTLTEFDHFKTRNTFNGVVLGLSAQTCRGCWSLESWAKLALGNNYSQVTINGQTTSTTPTQSGSPTVNTTPTGLLAQASNTGTYSHNQFAVIPEFGITVGRDLTQRWRATFGYTFFLWTGVARPGNQIDTSLNLTQLSPSGLSGPARPTFPWALTDVWAQGLNFGLDYRF